AGKEGGNRVRAGTQRRETQRGGATGERDGLSGAVVDGKVDIARWCAPKRGDVGGWGPCLPRRKRGRGRGQRDKRGASRCPSREVRSAAGGDLQLPDDPAAVGGDGKESRRPDDTGREQLASVRRPVPIGQDAVVAGGCERAQPCQRRPVRL